MKLDGTPMVTSIPHWSKLTPAEPRQRHCTPQEWAVFHPALRKRDADVADVALLYYILGWRRKEPLVLTWDQVDWDTKTIILHGRRRRTKRRT